MIESVVSSFLQKAVEITTQNPDVDHVYLLTAGDVRRRRETVPPGAQPFDPENEALFDVLCEKIEGLMRQPEKHCWLELRQKGKTRVLHYEHCDISDTEELEVITNVDASGVMAQQLVRQNEFCLNLLAVKERQISHISQKMFDTGLTLRQIETERYMESQLSQEQSLAKAVEALTPMLSVALAKWASTKQSAPQGNQTHQEPDQTGQTHREPDQANHATVDNGRLDVEELLLSIEYVCQHQKEELTQERINRVFKAFSG